MVIPTKKSSTKELSKWNDDMVRKYHKKGTLFESKNPLLKFVEMQRLKTMIKLGKIRPNNIVLDLGCGEGFFLTLLPKTKELYGIDISKVALKRAEKLTAHYGVKATLLHGNAQDLKISKHFDRIFCSEMLEHVPNPRLVIKNIHKIIKPNGLVVISVPDEKRIKNIMKFIKSLGISKFLHAARKNEDYDWHLHEADVDFVKKISRGYFKVVKLVKVPILMRHRIVAVLKKI